MSRTTRSGRLIAPADGQRFDCVLQFTLDSGAAWAA